MSIIFDNVSLWMDTSIPNGALERIDRWYDDGTYNDEKYITALVNYFSSAWNIVDCRGQYSNWMYSLDLRIKMLQEKGVNTQRLQLLEEVWAEIIDPNSSPEIVLKAMKEGQYNKRPTEDEAWQFLGECNRRYNEKNEPILNEDNKGRKQSRT